jgi:hypothetical protein
MSQETYITIRRVCNTIRSDSVHCVTEPVSSPVYLNGICCQTNTKVNKTKIRLMTKIHRFEVSVSSVNLPESKGYGFVKSI